MSLRLERDDDLFQSGVLLLEVLIFRFHHCRVAPDAFNELYYHYFHTYK